MGMPDHPSDRRDQRGDEIAPRRPTPVGPPDELAEYFHNRMPPHEFDGAARAAIIRWQGLDRFYERVQQVIREGADDDEADLTATILEDLIDRHEIGRTIVGWRGERDAHRAFGVTTDDLPYLIGRAFDTVGFYAVSMSREVAEEGFTTPGRDPVIVRATIAPNVHALWVAAAGIPELAEQRELLLFSPTVDIVKVTVTSNGRPPLVDIEIRR